MKSEEEMRELFSWCPEACDTTLEIADKCNYELDWSSMFLPKFPGLLEGETSEERFRKECEDGLAIRYGDDWDGKKVNGVDIRERFEYEYDVICTKGFADYFLIVQEYVRWAKQNGIGVGPGRGSAAGAIVAYAMDITTSTRWKTASCSRGSSRWSARRCPISIWTSTTSDGWR